MKLAIIGAGIAGLTCAHEAKSAGHDVTLFDKGRGPGGRLSTRRLDGPAGQVRFDHGAIGFKTHSKEFSDVARKWLANDWISLWKPRLARLDKSGLASIPDENFCVGTPAMNSLVKGLTEGLDVQFAVRIHQIVANGAGWTLTFEDDTEDFPCDGVICAVPAEQAAVLLDEVAPDLAGQARDVASLPCWTVMLAFSEPLGLDFDLVLGSGMPFTRLVRNSAKPGRDPAESWVLQAGPDWSADHVDWSQNDIVSELLSAFKAVTDTHQSPVSSTAHRWLYAFPAGGVGFPASWNEDLRIGTCGDWHIGPEVEHAWMSGRVLGERLKSLD